MSHSHSMYYRFVRAYGIIIMCDADDDDDATNQIKFCIVHRKFIVAGCRIPLRKGRREWVGDRGREIKSGKNNKNNNIDADDANWIITIIVPPPRMGGLSNLRQA